METYDKICLRLTQTTCKKETHRIAIVAMYKYGEFNNLLIQNNKETINGSTRNNNPSNEW